jgi:hypothetical protein
VRRLLTALVVAVAILAAATGPISAATRSGHQRPLPGLGIRLVDVPTATSDDPRARAYIIDNLPPGAAIERRVQVINGTGAPIDVSTYPAAASIQHGEFIGARGHSRNELSSWTSTRPKSVYLPRNGRSFVDVTIRIPPDAASGERYGVVWAQTTTPPQTPGGLTQVSRVGIRLYLSIGPGGAPASDFDIVSMTADRDSTNSPMVQASVHNTGGRALDLSGALALTDGPGGLSAGPFPITLGTTLGIDQTEPVTVPLDEQIPNGPWNATLTVRSGLTKRTAQATLTFPAGPGVGVTALTTPRGSRMSWWMPATAIAAELLMLMVLTRYLLRSRARHQRTKTSRAVFDRLNT